MNWNPQNPFPAQPQPGAFPGQPGQFPGQPQQPPAGAVPAYGMPPGQPMPAPQPGFAPAPAPQGFGVPQAPQGYAPAPGYAPQPAVAFQAQDPSLQDREDDCPAGTSSFVCTGEIELGGQGRNLLIVKCKTERSNNPQVQPGTPFAFKRSLVPHARWGLKYASDDIGKFIVAILGIDTKTTPPSAITPLINELVQRGTLNGQSIDGRRGIVTGVPKVGKPSNEFPQGKPYMQATYAKLG